MNKELFFSSKTNEWETPLDFFNDINKEFNFNLDPCATDYNHKCSKYFTLLEDGLLQSWGGIEFSVIHPTVENYING